MLCVFYHNKKDMVPFFLLAVLLSSLTVPVATCACTHTHTKMYTFCLDNPYLSIIMTHLPQGSHLVISIQVMITLFPFTALCTSSLALHNNWSLIMYKCICSLPDCKLHEGRDHVCLGRCLKVFLAYNRHSVISCGLFFKRMNTIYFLMLF